MADPTLQNGMTPGGTDKNGMAVASLVLGIIAVCCCCVSGLSLVLGILAIVFSISQQKGAEIVAATNQTEKMAHSREMDLAVFTDWFPDRGAFGAALDF